jgi:superfamily II DNA helicase RecQ
MSKRRRVGSSESHKKQTNTTTLTATTSKKSSKEAAIKESVAKTLTSVVLNSNLPHDFKFDAFQIKCFEHILAGQDLVVSLRTGGGKFLILALSILFCGATGTVYITVPLDMLAEEHKLTLTQTLGVPASKVVILKRENLDQTTNSILTTGTDDVPLYVLGHPEMLLELIHSRRLARYHRGTILACDEVQLITEWGDKEGFIPAWGQLRTILTRNDTMRFIGFGGSSTQEQLEDICRTLDIHKSSIVHGTMSRRDLELSIIEDFSGLPRRNEEWTKGKGTLLAYLMATIFRMVDKDPTHRGVIVWCESKVACRKFCAQLNIFLQTKSSTTGRQHAAYLYYNNNSLYSMKATLRMYGDPAHPCDILIGTVAFALGLNLPPTQSVLAKGSLNLISLMWQLFGRANRTRDASSTGEAMMVVSYKKYINDIIRAKTKVLLGYNPSATASAASKEVAAVQAIYKLALDCRLCLHQYIEHLFGDPLAQPACSEKDPAPCGNCKNKWRAVAAQTTAINAMAKPSTFAAGVQGMKTLLSGRGNDKERRERLVNKEFPKLRQLVVNDGVETEESKPSWEVLPTNKDISAFLQEQVIEILRNCNGGMKSSLLAKEVATRTGRWGLKNKDVERCLWWYLVCGYLCAEEVVAVGAVRSGAVNVVDSDADSDDEDTDAPALWTPPATEAGEGGDAEATKKKNAWNVNITSDGYLTKIWDEPSLNERLGNFCLEEGGYFVPAD